jgi:hypothetical protein
MFSFAPRALLWLAAPATHYLISGQRKTSDMNLPNHNNS